MRYRRPRRKIPKETLSWSGVVVAVQPRIRLTRSYDQRTHTYQGYLLRLEGRIGDEDRVFTIGVGKGAHKKHQFQIDDQVSGVGHYVLDEELEIAELYKVSKLEVSRGVAKEDSKKPPPWLGVPPELEVYRARGHRRLAAQTYELKCTTCIWGCLMPVEMIIDQWNPRKRRYRTETFCYGPKSCRFYKAGPTRKVPGRRGMSWEEEDWVDEQETKHRGPEE